MRIFGLTPPAHAQIGWQESSVVVSPHAIVVRITRQGRNVAGAAMTTGARRWEGSTARGGAHARPSRVLLPPSILKGRG